MLKIYLSSVLVYMIIIYCMCWLFEKPIKANGWANESNSVKANKFVVLFCLSSVPIIRLVAVAMILFMTGYTKEDLEKFKAEVEEERTKNLD